MPSFVPAALGQPYFNAVSAITSKTGDWISCGDGLDVISFEFEWSMGVGTVTGNIAIQHTSQLNGTMPSNGSVILLPLGSLHTNMATATLDLAPNPSTQVTLTALTTGRLSIVLGQIPAGNIRAIYTRSSGSGASPNTLSVWCTGWGR